VAGDILQRGGVLFTEDADGCTTWDVIVVEGGGGRILERGQGGAVGAVSYDFYFAEDGLFVVDGPHYAPESEIDVELEEVTGVGGHWIAEPDVAAALAGRWRAGDCPAADERE